MIGIQLANSTNESVLYFLAISTSLITCGFSLKMVRDLYFSAPSAAKARSAKAQKLVVAHKFNQPFNQLFTNTSKFLTAIRLTLSEAVRLRLFFARRFLQEGTNKPQPVTTADGLFSCCFVQLVFSLACENKKQGKKSTANSRSPPQRTVFFRAVLCSWFFLSL